MDEMEEIEIVIVGGGICGLATALALHRYCLFPSFLDFFLIPCSVTYNF